MDETRGHKYTAYQTRICECFAQAYRFLDEHKQARTQEDWNQIVKDIGAYTDPLTVGLIIACTEELEREYYNTTRKQLVRE